MRRVFLFFTTLFITLSALAQFAGGKGTAEDPYLIADAYQLADMQNYRSSYFKLINDIDLTEWIEDNSPDLGWNPIGTQSSPFEGDFDGNEHYISGLTINRPNQDYVGLFGVVGYVPSHKIRNLSIHNPNVIGRKFSSILCGAGSISISNIAIIEGSLLKGSVYNGAICGRLIEGVIQNCEVHIQTISSSGTYLGGICGYSGSKIENCIVSIQNLSSSGGRLGGICGYCKGAIEKCTVLVNEIHSSYHSPNGGAAGIGGICGDSGDNLSDNIIIAGSIVYQGNVSDVGGVVGQIWSDGRNINISRCIAIIQSIKTGTSYGNRGGICAYTNMPVGKGTKMNINECYAYVNTYGDNIVCNVTTDDDDRCTISNCIVDGVIESINGHAYGIARESKVNQCLVLCPLIKGHSSVAGISILCSNSVCVSEKIVGDTEAYRISTGASPDNNKSHISTKRIVNGAEIETYDDARNGTALGDKTLKRASTYIGLGWDLVNTWRINEGEDYPYLRMLSEYPTVTKYETTNNCRLTGTCPVNGKIYVMKNGATYTSDIVDNAFDINVGAVNVGDTLLYFSMPEGAKPSMVRKLILTEGTTDPSGDIIKGDANGDSVVDAADVVSTVNSILGKPSSTFVKKNADVNEDGQILVDDAVGTVNIIMNNQ